MSAAKKRRKPANDLHPQASQAMSYVRIPRRYWHGTRIVAAGVLLCFISITIAAVLANRDIALPPIAKSIATLAPAQPAAPPEKPADPYDITINASELAPPPSVVEDALPITITPLHILPQVLDITVEDHKNILPQETDNAAAQSAAALTLERQGDIQQALHFQHRAASLDPNNMLLRLQLAILYDHSGDAKDAFLLYRQVIQAYQAQDESLPQTIAIKDIRQRAAYLASRAQ